MDISDLIKGLFGFAAAWYILSDHRKDVENIEQLDDEKRHLIEKYGWIPVVLSIGLIIFGLSFIITAFMN